MKNSIQKLEILSNSLDSHLTYYKFNKIDENISLSYRKGRINAAKWLNELIFLFLKKEANFLQEFKEYIQREKKQLSDLDQTDFKQGLFDELNLIEEMIEKI